MITRRYKITLEYCGTPFVGWQKQPVGLSVQTVLEKAFKKAGEPIIEGVVAAGRTDSGVHAVGQVIHADLIKDWDEEGLQGALNFHLKPHPISVIAVKRVSDDFHARFSATERVYLYRILCRRPPPTCQRGLVWHVKYPINLDDMKAGAEHLTGTYDFTTFRASLCQAKSPIKTVDEISLWQGTKEQEKDQILCRVRARSFLHNQIRSFVGSLVKVGVGKWPANQIAVARDARDRTQCGPVAPSEGLYLTDVFYGDGM